MSNINKRRIRIILAAAAAVFFAVLLFVWLFMQQAGKDQTTATITLNDEVLLELDLSSVKDTTTMTVGEPGSQNTIRISPDGIQVISADCPDQVCVDQGLRAHGPEPIVCLPHRLVIRFSDGGEEQLDAVTGR